MGHTSLQSPAGPSVAGGGKYELGYDEIGGKLLLPLADPLDPHLDHDRGAADVQRCGHGDDLVAREAGAEDVELELDRREVVPRRDAAEGGPGGDGVAERGPGAAVDEAARVQVALVYDDAPTGMRVLD